MAPSRHSSRSKYHYLNLPPKTMSPKRFCRNRPVSVNIAVFFGIGWFVAAFVNIYTGASGRSNDHVAALLSVMRLLLAQDQVHNPAAPNMWPFASAMAQNVGVRAARFFESIGKNRHVLEAAFLVNGLGDFRDRAIVPSQPRRIDSHGAKQEWSDHVTK